MSASVVATDLEGTLTTGETWRIVGQFLKTHGRRSDYQRFYYSRLPTALLARAKLINGQRFREQWFEGMTGLLKGFTRDRANALMDVILEELWQTRRPSVLDEIERHRAEGARIIVASGTYQQVADAFAKCIGAEAIGTPMAFDSDGHATGKLAGALTTGETKAALVREALRGDTLVAAYGDTEGDIPMLSMCASPVVVCPDATLRAKAIAGGWRIIES